ncbi:MAG TPA: hypothetical protein VMC02_08160 [Steroidobacteraceae bacterium]|nr:hypothetical protein [Steroidobacteraceae bacterium]
MMYDTRSHSRATVRLLGMACAMLATAALAQAPASAPARSANHEGKRPGEVAGAKLDLHAPPLNHIYPSRQLQYILAPDDSSAEMPEVRVKGTRQGVVVPGTPGNQLLAVPWAILHPTQAWRIFTPLVEP